MPRVNPHTEFGDILPEKICDIMAKFPTMIGIGIASQTNAGGRMWEGWRDDDDFNARPQLYRTRKAAERAMARANAAERMEVSLLDWELTLWIAPIHEWSESPIDKYMQMNGQQFPGSPRH